MLIDLEEITFDLSLKIRGNDIDDNDIENILSEIENYTNLSTL